MQTLADNVERATGLGVFVWDVTPDRVIWSAEFARLHSLTSDLPPTSEAWLSAVHADDRKAVRAAVAALPRPTTDRAADPDIGFLEHDYREPLEAGDVRWIA